MTHSNNFCQMHFVFSISSLLMKFTHLQTTLQISLLCDSQPHTYAEMQPCNSPGVGSTGSTLLLSKPFLDSNCLVSTTYFFPSFWRNSPHWAKASSLTKLLDQTMTHHSQ